MVRRRHRAQVVEVRVRAVQRRGDRRRCCAAWVPARRRFTASARDSSSRSSAARGERHDREPRELARTLGAELGLPDDALDGLASSYERWDGRGWPGKMSGDDIPIVARVVHLAEFAEVAHRVGGIDAALAARRTAKGHTVRSVARRRASARRAEGLRPPRRSGFVGHRHRRRAVARRSRSSDEQCDDALRAIGRFVDLKSPSRLGHSLAVAELASAAGHQLALPGRRGAHACTGRDWCWATAGSASRTRSGTSGVRSVGANGRRSGSTRTSRERMLQRPSGLGSARTDRGAAL